MTETVKGWVGVIGSSLGLKKVILPRKSKAEIQKLIALQSDINNELFNFDDILLRLREYFKGNYVVFNDKLDMGEASLFQRKVWEAARAVSYGTTVSYGLLAEKIGCRSPRAVGQALGRNPLPIIVPCHRIIGSNGSLTGFSDGIEMKRYLLDLENGRQ